MIAYGKHYFSKKVDYGENRDADVTGYTDPDNMPFDKSAIIRCDRAPLDGPSKKVDGVFGFDMIKTSFGEEQVI